MRISIFAKLALTFLVIVAGLVTFLSVNTARDLEQTIDVLVLDRGERVVRGIDREADRLLSELESKLNGMADNFEFHNSLIGLINGTSPQDELIDRVVELRNIADLDYLWVVGPNGTLLGSGHDPDAWGPNLINPPGTYSEHLSTALGEESVRYIGVETISAHSLFVAEVFVPVTSTDRLLGREQIDGVLWGADTIDSDFIERLADLAGAEIVAIAPDVPPLASWLSSGENFDSELLAALSGDRSDINLNNEIYEISTLPFPRSESDSYHDPVTLHLLIPKSDLLASKRALLRNMLVEAIIGGIIAMFLAFLISKSITYPIERLKTGVTALASGDLSRRVEVHSRDEIEDLVKSFNTMADELDANTRRLVEAEKLSAWREVARRLAHEIKNPLSPIKLSIQNLVRVYKGHPEKFSNQLTETSETILVEVDRLKTLADEFSNFARMPKPVLTRNDLGDVVKGSVALFDRPEVGVKIEFICRDEIPAVMFDRDALSRVFTNLIKNAVEAMGDRSGKILVRISTFPIRQMQWVSVTLADQGVGMDREELKQSFNPYFTTKRGGSGLGLAIVQSIVSEHKGRIRIDSEVGKGTVVVVELPAAQTDKTAE